VRPVVQPWKKEVLRAPIVWPGNLKKPQAAQAKRSVPFVCLAVTPMHQTGEHVANVHLVTLNSRLVKHHVQCVVQARLVRGAKIAHQVMHEVVQILIRHSANNVNWEKQQRSMVRRRAVGAI